MLPEGFRIEPFSSELAGAFHATLEEAFADHWEYQPQGYEEWWERQVAKPDHDPSLWFLVRVGEDVVAATRNDPERSGGGWIGSLGVRRAVAGPRSREGPAAAQLPRVPPARAASGRPRSRFRERNRCDEAVRKRRHGRRHGAGRMGEVARVNVRPFTEDDAPAVAALVSAEEERLYGRPGRLTAEDVLLFLPHSKEAWVWEEDGRLVATRDVRRARRRCEHPRDRRCQGPRPRDGDPRARRGVRARGRGEEDPHRCGPSPTPRGARCSSRVATARCGASTRWRSS